MNIDFGDDALFSGRIKEGFEAYERRRELPEIAEYTESIFQAFGLTSQQLEPYRWKGQNLSRKTILVFPEQGYGDVIFFSRFLLPLKQKKCTILLKVQDRLEALFQESFAFCDYLSPNRAHKLDIQFVSSMLSLPCHLKVGKYDRKGRYINPPKQHQRQQLVAGEGARRKVGICWRTNVDTALSAVKSIDLPTILSEVAHGDGEPGAELYSFQLEPTETERQQMASAGIHDLSAALTDFSDTAFFLSKMDHVVTIDTAVAHLAAAIGQPTTVLITGRREWRWAHDDGRSRWYRSATVRELRG